MSRWDEVGLPEGWRLLVLEETDSTNDEARRRAGEAEGLVVLAERQTAGRGRRGAVWYSAPDEDLTFSVLLRPDEPKALWPRLSLAVGLAVAEALGKLGVEAEIKWPNDVRVGGKKMCGILVEAGSDHAAVGIGLNVGAESFPEAIAASATSLRLERGSEISRTEALETLLAELAGWMREIGAGFPDVLRKVRVRCALSGKRVRLVSGDGLIEGRVREIGDAGELVVETVDGVKRVLQAHEVREL